MDPVIKFQQWYKEELQRSNVRIPSACCLSTIGMDGYPNARFVSLKEVIAERFIVTGPISSRKGIEIANLEKVALTFWWIATERQVRIQGNANLISDEEAEKYFKEREKESNIVSMISDQGKPIEDPEKLIRDFKIAESHFKDKEIPKPKNWGGFAIEPIRMELMQFKENRFHDRQLYIKKGVNWDKEFLQP